MVVKFITGGAGTGKSFQLRKRIKNESRKFVVCAPTGIAAQNVGGVTIHSAFNISPESLFVPSSIARGPLAGLKVIYIDEASMLGADLFKCVLYAAAHLQVEEIVLVGDLAQLPPVKDKPFHFLRMPDEIEELTTVHRQADDLDFAEILNAIRVGEVSYNQVQWINQHAYIGLPEDPGVTLAYANATVDSINAKALHQLPGDMHLFEAKLSGGMSEKDVLAPKELYLKEGARVMMLNNTEDWSNGTLAEVVQCYEDTTEDCVQVRIKDELYDVTPHTWTKKAPKELRGGSREAMEELATGTDPDQREYAQHCLNNGYELAPVGSFTQLPMKLASALTVHKSQGTTLDRARIIPDGFNRMHGIGYVALSRLTSVEGLSLSRKLQVNDFKIDSRILL